VEQRASTSLGTSSTRENRCGFRLGEQHNTSNVVAYGRGSERGHMVSAIERRLVRRMLVSRNANGAAMLVGDADSAISLRRMYPWQVPQGQDFEVERRARTRPRSESQQKRAQH
jgi:hypothetical protein